MLLIGLSYANVCKELLDDLNRKQRHFLVGDTAKATYAFAATGARAGRGIAGSLGRLGVGEALAEPFLALGEGLTRN